MNRTAKTIIGVQAAIILALVGFIAWAALTPAPNTSTESSKYPGVQSGTIEVGYLDNLATNGIRVMDNPAEHVQRGHNTCQHKEDGDQVAALNYLRDQTDYTQRDRLIVYQVAESSLCAVN